MKTIKIIRDNFTEQDAGAPDNCVLNEISSNPSQHRSFLVLKMYEEVAEIARDMKDPAEYADLLETLQVLAKLSGLSWSEILWIQDQKRQERGSFNRGILMEIP